jgi:hypothetical protein
MSHLLLLPQVHGQRMPPYQGERFRLGVHWLSALARNCTLPHSNCSKGYVEGNPHHLHCCVALHDCCFHALMACRGTLGTTMIDQVCFIQADQLEPFLAILACRKTATAFLTLTQKHLL